MRRALLSVALLVIAAGAAQADEPGRLTVRLSDVPWYTPEDAAISVSIVNHRYPMTRDAFGRYSVTLPPDLRGHQLFHFSLDESGETDAKGDPAPLRDLWVPDSGGRTEDFTVQGWHPYYRNYLQMLALKLALLLGGGSFALFAYRSFRMGPRRASVPVGIQMSPDSASLSAAIVELKSKTRELERWSRVLQKRE